MTLKEYALKEKMSLRDAYRLVEKGSITVKKELRAVEAIRKMWVLVVVDPV